MMINKLTKAERQGDKQMKKIFEHNDSQYYIKGNTIYDRYPTFRSASGSEGVQKVGQLNGRYKVYKNPYMKSNVVLLGFRGSQFLETGAVFAPYIPLIMTPLVYDPNTFTPRKGLLTRYAKKMVRPEFYGIIDIHGLNTL